MILAQTFSAYCQNLARPWPTIFERLAFTVLDSWQAKKRTGRGGYQSFPVYRQAGNAGRDRESSSKISGDL